MQFKHEIKFDKHMDYSSERGYGFVRSRELSINEELRDSWPGDYFIPSVPTFMMDVPNGNYKVILTLGSESKPTVTTVKEGLGRLKLHEVKTLTGNTITKTFAVNVEDGQLKLAFAGKNPVVQRIEIERVTSISTMFLVGDSTVTDQASGKYPYTGWGQMIGYFLDERIAVSNHARSGKSSKSFIEEGRLTRIEKKIRKGDYLFIQFAHNDQKEDERYTDPFTTYQNYLSKYIAIARAKKAIPVVVTPMHRRNFNEDGSINNTHGKYIEAVKQLAKEEEVFIVDLAYQSKKYFEEIGKNLTKNIFMWAAPGKYKNFPKGIQDNTHFSEFGAFKIANLVVKGIKESGITLPIRRC
ncbi:rhamnogalacturonan acetylesterase [Gracilibacillus timonensis]|uniref:rhamnogalacturonan acetylesterase n=1 Tax=Gracilibacillus timonensis TaxID=1816696 RepID=UPI0008243C5C|nr:rhamnogalacturonan acetylesterase [Gracilibacillus timonensis]